MKFYSEIDDKDIAILKALQTDSSISNVELARRVELSPPAVHSRIKRLEQDGYIQQYPALLNRERMGFDMLCFIQVNLQLHQSETVQAFREAIVELPEVLECYHVTGGIDYLLKIVVADRQHLQRFLMDQLTTVPGIARIQTSIALGEVKSTTSLPIDILNGHSGK